MTEKSSKGVGQKVKVEVEVEVGKDGGRQNAKVYKSRQFIR
jgi:outer membrane biosynthesis protein TonB